MYQLFVEWSLDGFKRDTKSEESLYLSFSEAELSGWNTYFTALRISYRWRLGELIHTADDSVSGSQCREDTGFSKFCYSFGYWGRG
jgi:hypothetical protein